MEDRDQPLEDGMEWSSDDDTAFVRCTVGKLYQTMEAFASALNDWDGEDVQNSVATDLACSTS